MSGKTSGKTVKEQLLEKLTPRELVTAACAHSYAEAHSQTTELETE